MAQLLVLKVLTSLAAMALCLSPLPSTLAIYRQRHTGEVALLPLVAFLISCHLWMLYGYVTDDIFPLCVTFVFGDVMSLLYIVVFYRFTTYRTYTHKTIAAGLFVIALVTIYAVLGKTGVTQQSDDAVEQTFGIITACGAVLLYSSPLATCAHVLRTKNSASIPWALCLAGAVSNALWIIYGAVEGDWFIGGLGIFCVTFAMLQVVLYVIYRPGRHGNAIDQDSDITTPVGYEVVHSPFVPSPAKLAAINTDGFKV